MTSPARTRHGRFDSDYDESSLFALLRDVALFVDPESPAKVSQPRWDRGRAGAGHPTAPTARAIYMRLNRHRKVPRPWAELLVAACNPDASHRQTLVALQQQAALYIGDEHVVFALRCAADHLGYETLTPDDYDEAREQLIERDQRRDSGGLLPELLPTAHQIERHTDGWDAALDLAGLAARNGVSAARRPSASNTPVTDVIELFLEQNQRWPSRAGMAEFVRRAEIAMRHPRQQPWRAWIDEVRESRRERGLPCPLGYAPHGRAAEGLEIRIPDQLPPGFVKASRRSPERCIEALQEFDRELPAGRRRTTRAYRRAARDYPAWPALSTIGAHGTFTHLLAEAQQRNHAARNTAADCDPG